MEEFLEDIYTEPDFDDAAGIERCGLDLAPPLSHVDFGGSIVGANDPFLLDAYSKTVAGVVEMRDRGTR